MNKVVYRCRANNPRTFTFTCGNLVVLNATGPTSGPLKLSKMTCAFARSSGGTCDTGRAAAEAKTLVTILFRGPLGLNEGNCCRRWRNSVFKCALR